ncbi:hypothetical protein ANN_05382, partial [Periplaneta americana]
MGVTEKKSRDFIQNYSKSDTYVYKVGAPVMAMFLIWPPHYSSFPGYATIPTTTNQTLVISQLGVISNQPNILPAHSASTGAAKPTDMQKVLGSKSVGGNGGVLKGSGQQSSGPNSGYVVSQPQQLQTPTTAMLGTSQAQFLGPIQYTTCGGRTVQPNSQPMQFAPWQFAGASLPQGITWATTAPGGIQSPAALLTPNQIFIRGQQDGTGMFIQSPPPQIQSHNPTIATPAAMPSVQQMTGKPRQTMDMLTNIQPKTAVPRAQSNILPSVVGSPNIRPASSVSTQTGGSTQMNATSTQVQTQKAQTKVRTKPAVSRTSPAPGGTTQKADAANQTKPQAISPASQNQQMGGT